MENTACLDIQGQVRLHPMQEVYHQILQPQKVAKQNQQFPIAPMLTKSVPKNTISEATEPFGN